MVQEADWSFPRVLRADWVQASSSAGAHSSFSPDGPPAHLQGPAGMPQCRHVLSLLLRTACHLWSCLENLLHGAVGAGALAEVLLTAALADFQTTELFDTVRHWCLRNGGKAWHLLLGYMCTPLSLWVVLARSFCNYSNFSCVLAYLHIDASEAKCSVVQWRR